MPFWLKTICYCFAFVTVEKKIALHTGALQFPTLTADFLIFVTWTDLTFSSSSSSSVHSYDCNG